MKQTHTIFFTLLFSLSQLALSASFDPAEWQQNGEMSVLVDMSKTPSVSKRKPTKPIKPLDGTQPLADESNTHSTGYDITKVINVE